MSAKQLQLAGAVGSEDAATRVGRAAFNAILAARKGNAAFRLTESALIEATRPALAKELPKATRVNGRNPLFDALATACGLDPNKMTRSAAGQVAKALKEIREIEPGVTAEELAWVAVAVRRKYDNAGPMGVSAHFHEFAWAKRDRERKGDVPTALAGWLDVLNMLFPESTMARGGAFEITKETDYNWQQLDSAVRDAILKAMR